MIYKIIFIYLVGFVIFAILNTVAFYWGGGEKLEEAKLKGATIAIFWFLELPQLIIEAIKRGVRKK